MPWLQSDMKSVDRKLAHFVARWVALAPLAWALMAYMIHTPICYIGVLLEGLLRLHRDVSMNPKRPFLCRVYTGVSNNQGASSFHD